MKVILTLCLCLCSVMAIPQNPSERSRHLRPTQNCGGNRCPPNGRGYGRPSGGYQDDYYDTKSEQPDDSYKRDENGDKDRPAILGPDGWPSTSTGGRPGVGSDFKPKPPGRGGHGGYPNRDYPAKPISGGDDEYIPKPVAGDYDDDYYPPKPVTGGGDGGGTDDYNPKPVKGEDSDRGTGDYNPNPVPPDDGYVDDYLPKPVRPDKDRYKPDEDKDGGYNKKDDKVGGGDGTIDEGVGSCICVPYYQCKDGHIVTDGSGIIDARKKPEPEEELPLDGKFKPPSCGPFHVCCHTPETSTVKPYEHKCGVRNPSGINSRILSPSSKGEADFGEWPWQAAILKSEGSVNIFQCGGVLIDQYHIVTVAHCVYHLYKYSDYPLKVRLGEWDTQSTKEFLAHEDYRVAKITIHPEYRNNSLWNDIAILKLTEAVPFQPHIDTVCLPKHDENFAGQNCIVTGWGKDAYKGGTFSNIMKEVALPVIDNYKCEEMLRKTRLGRFFQLHEGFLCAGGEHGVDSCKGDGGGPIVCYRKDRSYALAGIVSWGIDCGQPGVPGVYVKMQKYLNWISKITGYQLQEYWPNSAYGR